jgi:hypothetical protein
MVPPMVNSNTLRGHLCGDQYRENHGSGQTF